MSAAVLIPRHTPVGAWRRVASFPTALCSLLAVLAVLTARSRFDDPDMWWHLKTGQIIWNTRRIPFTDIFSYTTHHHAWVPHEWLSQVLIYGGYRLGGYAGLMLWLCIATTAVLVAGYALCSLYSRNAKVGFAGALMIWFFATSGLSIRPQMLGYLLLILELLLMHLGRTRNPRWFFLLPLLFVSWVNCHGSFFLGFAILGIFLLSSFVNFRVGPLVSSVWSASSRKMLAPAVILSVAATLLNPAGMRQVLYPLNLMLHQPINLSQVEEWQPLQLNDGRGLGFLAILVCFAAVLIARRTELYWDEVWMLGLGVWLAASHRRMLFVFGILAAPILCRMLAPLWEGYDAEQDRALPNAVVIAASMLVAFWSFPGSDNLMRQVDEQSPVKAVDFMKIHHLSGPMLNDYVYGGYLIWTAPEQPVFVDGRTDIFEWTGVLREFGKWATLQSDPGALLEKYEINLCLLSRTSPMAHVIPLLHNWKTVYSDSQSVIFVRAAPPA